MDLQDTASLSKRLLDYIFLPTRIEHKKYLSRPLLIGVLIIAVFLMVLSIPSLHNFFFELFVSKSDRISIITQKAIHKAWLGSISFTLDIIVALLIGGSIFGERLAKSFAKSIQKYEETRGIALGIGAKQIETILSLKINEAIETIQEFKNQKGLKNVIKSIPKVIRASKVLYNTAFDQVPTFYKRYTRFVLYSSFPGGLYGLLAFTVFVISSCCKLASIYLDSPYIP